MKYLKIDIDEICVFAIITFATALRIILASLGWPITNSDEGTMGIMALHIAYHGEHPYFFYGQNYMGSLEAYIGAALFHLFGPSLFVLRLSVILLIALFLLSMYLLTSLLYSKKLALVTLALLSLGSNMVLTRQIMATGGSAETLLFGSLAFLLATWLALTYSQDPLPKKHWWRLLGYSCWGLVVGLGLWSDLVVLPFFAMAGLLLALFCWRELRTWAPLSLLLGLIIGTFPLLLYNFKALHLRGENSLIVLLGLFHGGATQAPRSLAQILQGIKATILVSLPTATSNPFCPVSEEPQYFPYITPHSITCTIIHASWGLGYIVLWTIAVFLTLRPLLRNRSRASIDSPDERRTIIRHFARLMLLGAAGLALTVYALSSAPLGWPGIHARYLIGLLIVTPAIISPLWSGVSAIKLPLGRLAKVRGLVSGAMLLLIGALLLTGTVSTFREIPSAQAVNQRQDMMINKLLHLGATHIYTDYWTCDHIAFQSQERITCVVLDGDLHPSHNRYLPYLSVLRADPHPAYVFPMNQAVTIAQRAVTLSGKRYQHFVFNGYVIFIYQPT